MKRKKKRYLYYLKALQQEGIKRTRHINPLNKIQCYRYILTKLPRSKKVEEKNKQWQMQVIYNKRVYK